MVIAKLSGADYYLYTPSHLKIDFDVSVVYHNSCSLIYIHT